MKLSSLMAILIAVVLILSSVAVIGAAPAANPGKGPIDKIVFIHHPKQAPGKPPNMPGKGPGVGEGVLCADYKYTRIHWADPTAIEYYINPANSSVFEETVINALNAAFATWDNADGPLGYLYQGKTGLSGGVQDYNNVVSWDDISTEYPNAIAVTSVWYYRYNREIVEIDTQMNSTLAWSYTDPGLRPDLSDPAVKDANRYLDSTKIGPEGTYDIQNIMTHEAGHWIMLDDLYKNKDSKLTMYGYGDTQELKKDTLAYGDELGVEHVYP